MREVWYSFVKASIYGLHSGQLYSSPITFASMVGTVGCHLDSRRCDPIYNTGKNSWSLPMLRLPRSSDALRRRPTAGRLRPTVPSRRWASAPHRPKPEKYEALQGLNSRDWEM